MSNHHQVEINNIIKIIKVNKYVRSIAQMFDVRTKNSSVL